jgi:protein-tyrosine phosphatase
MLDEPGVDLTDPRCGSATRPPCSWSSRAGRRSRRTPPPSSRASGPRGSCPWWRTPSATRAARRRTCAPGATPGAAVQATAESLGAPGARGEAARALLAVGALDVLASDNHGDARGLAAARGLLAAAGASDAAELLTAENPARLLRGDPPLPVPPTVLRVGVWARLVRAVLPGAPAVGAAALPSPAR